MLDIEKMCDTVCHGEVRHQARLRSYPLGILNLSLRSYLWPRRLVGMSGITTACIVPTRSIAAGSPFAIYEAALSVAGAAQEHVSLPRHWHQYPC